MDDEQLKDYEKRKAELGNDFVSLFNPPKKKKKNSEARTDLLVLGWVLVFGMVLVAFLG